MNIFKRVKNVVVKSEVQPSLTLPQIESSGNHIFALHNESIFTIVETDGGVKIDGVLFTKAQAVKQLENVADGLRFIASQLK
jgi:hypothetical protein